MNQNPVANSQMNRVEDATSEYLCEDCARDNDPAWKEDRDFLSYEELSAAFGKCVQHLQESKCHEVLTRFFDHEHKVTITQCICLALGNFGIRDQEDTESGEFIGPLHQLAVLTVLLQVLRTKHDIRDVVFQDPSFRPVEIQFLDSLGYTVLDDPDAFDMMSPSTFLFAPYCPDIVTYKALKSPFPALYIGNDPRSVIISIMCRRSGLERMRARRQVDTFFRFANCTKQGESMMPVFDGEVWVADAQVRWLSPEYKKFERGFSLVFFFLFELFVFLLMAWKRVKNRFVTE